MNLSKEFKDGLLSDVIYEADLSSRIYRLYGSNNYESGSDLSNPELTFDTLEEIIEFFNNKIIHYDSYEILNTITLKAVSFNYSEIKPLLKMDMRDYLDIA